MIEEANEELQRLDAAIVAAEARLTRKFDSLLVLGEKGGDTFSAERQVSAAEQELDRLRAHRAQLLSDQSAGK